MTQLHARGISASTSVDESWLALKGQFRVLWILLLGGLPGVFLLAYLASALFKQDAILPGIALIWMAVTAWAGVRVASFACPRCGKAFFENWYFFKMLRSQCAYCGLERGARKIAPEESEAAAP